jgi:hypothetical protein
VISVHEFTNAEFIEGEATGGPMLISAKRNEKMKNSDYAENATTRCSNKVCAACRVESYGGLAF